MLVSGAASGQDKLSQAAQSSAKTITQLTDVVKLGAASIGSDDPETQVSRPRSSASYLFQITPLLSQTGMAEQRPFRFNCLSGSSFDNSVSLSPGGSDKCRERCGKSSG